MKGEGEEKVGEGGRGGEMTQTMYAHVNKWIIKKKERDGWEKNEEKRKRKREVREEYILFRGWLDISPHFPYFFTANKIY
jgi:hypothetical protein